MQQIRCTVGVHSGLRRMHSAVSVNSGCKGKQKVLPAYIVTYRVPTADTVDMSRYRNDSEQKERQKQTPFRYNWSPVLYRLHVYCVGTDRVANILDKTSTFAVRV